MDRYSEIQTKPKEVDQSNSENDPRIDSPNIEVIYPTQTREIPVEQIKEAPKHQPPEPPQESKEHECKVDLQTAIKQNLQSFVLIALLILGIGYMIGKK